MKSFSVLVGVFVPAFLVAGAVVNPAMAQGMGAEQKVFVDNDKVRVYDVTFKPGAENKSIPTSSLRVVRAMTGGTLQRTYADGKKENVVYKTGEVRLNEKSPAYTAKNIGKTDVRLYVVVLK